VDLRDGVRLTKLTELLIHDTSVRGGTLDLLRVPANSRLQKMHNVGLALKSLYGSLGPTSRGQFAGQCSKWASFSMQGTQSTLFSDELSITGTLEDLLRFSVLNNRSLLLKFSAIPVQAFLILSSQQEMFFNTFQLNH
jgi:hypothetical protein